ncbi:hypothetical protein Bca4012_019747 [Brassica carinata]
MLALARWQPRKSQLFPSEITFWVKVLGVPMDFRTVPTFESIGDAIGRTVTVDLDHSRIQVVVDAFKELCFETTLDFKGGEFYDGVEAPVSLRYEKLFGYCQHCSSLCHKDEKCPLGKKNTKKSPERKSDLREDYGGWYDGGKHEERARSYKGVVIHGNATNQHRERDGRDYYGKGKGKMVKDAESKWVKIAEKRNKSSSAYRGNHRGEGDASRCNHRDETKYGEQEGLVRSSAGQINAQQVQVAPQGEVREEGEITTDKENTSTLPSHEFQEQLEKTQAVGTEVVSDPTDAEEGLQVIQNLVEDQTAQVDDHIMEWDEINAIFLENGIDMDAEDDLQDLSEEEMDTALMVQTEETHNQEKEEQFVAEEEKEHVTGEGEKKQGNRKRLFKPTVSTAASTKMRTTASLVSPRKRAAAKTGSRHGERSKQPEGKGSSNPGLGTSKA